jgi:4-amino-4-deoxy-L-arabinose transferase-like glycosyltransferase
VALVIACFCAPLFVGLGGRDLGNDESIYSYAVDRIIETGDWLTPRAIPFDGPFLEKPPLKFWIVAAPIAAGLLPADEFGLRAVDALFGGFAFLYVFMLGRWQSGVVGGVVSVLVLYTLEPVVQALRTNTMEASLLLSYVGGVYHFARWNEARGEGTAAWHRWPVALYFALGFLTKFVAILFLPLICLAAVVMRRDGLASLRATWRAWIAPAGLVLILIAPWFAYQTAVRGRIVWAIMFGQHIYTRFTGALDVSHLHPWNYYVSNLWLQLQTAGWHWLAVAGAALLVVDACRRDRWLPRVLLFWGIVPFALVSLGSSKLFHYILPFVPAVALAAGHASALVFDAASALGVQVLARIREWLPDRVGWATRFERLRRGLILAAVLAALTALITAVHGRISWQIDAREVFQNSSLTRPLLIAALLLLAAGEVRWAARSLAVPLLLLILPMAAYSNSLKRASIVDRPLRAARDCMIDVRRSRADVGRTVYNTAPSLTYHSYNYYLRAFEPWVRVNQPDPVELRRRLLVAGQQSPVLISAPDYVRVQQTTGSGANATSETRMFTGFSADPGLIVLLPGPYESCAAVAGRAGGSVVEFGVHSE